MPTIDEYRERRARGRRRHGGSLVEHCAVLMMSGEANGPLYAAFLRETGFRVTEVRAWPENNDDIRNYHAVILRLRKIHSAAMIAARLRAKPHFGRRLLMALVDADVAANDRRMALEAGFDEVVNDDGNCRLLLARLLRRLRGRPELRCVLPPPRKSAVGGLRTV